MTGDEDEQRRGCVGLSPPSTSLDLHCELTPSCRDAQLVSSMDRETVPSDIPPISAELFTRLRQLDGRYSISASWRHPWPEAVSFSKPPIWLTGIFAGRKSCGLGWQSEHPVLSASFELTLQKMETDQENAVRGHVLPPLISRQVLNPPIDAALWRRVVEIEELCRLSFYRSDYLNWTPRPTADALPMWQVSFYPWSGKMWRSHHVERPTLAEAVRVALDTAPIAQWAAEAITDRREVTAWLNQAGLSSSPLEPSDH